MERVCASRPEKSSIVETMGRALRGTFVSGIIAMKMLMRMERARGYPDVPMILDVISSLTSSPNMRIPATAVDKSRRYYCLLGEMSALRMKDLTVKLKL